MENKIRDLDIRYTELAKYLNISRPTLYKYIEDFNRKQYSKIDYYVLDVLKFIKRKTTVSKLQVIDYIIKQKQMLPNDHLVEKMKKLIDNEKKEELLVKLLDIFKKDDFEEIIEKINKKFLEDK